MTHIWFLQYCVNLHNGHQLMLSSWSLPVLRKSLTYTVVLFYSKKDFLFRNTIWSFRETIVACTQCTELRWLKIYMGGRVLKNFLVGMYLPTGFQKSLELWKDQNWFCGLKLGSWGQIFIKISRGGHLYFRLDIIRVKGLSKHTLNTYFSGMKIDPKYVFLHVFFLICPPCPFQNLSICQKTHPFFQFCTFLHP